MQKASSSEAEQFSPQPRSSQSDRMSTQGLCHDRDSRFSGEQTCVTIDSVSPGASEPLTRLQGGAVSRMWSRKIV